MIKNLILALLISTTFSSCKEGSASDNNIKKTDSTINISNSFDETMLDGIWAENEHENAIFEIKNDSVRYIEFYEQPYFYELHENSFKIYMDENYISESKIITLDKDSLILDTEDGILSLYRRLK